MTGAYLFAIRDGQRTPVEVEHLTDEERISKFKNDPQRALQFLHVVCNKLKEIEDKYFIKEEK